MFKLFWSIKALRSAQYFAWRVILNRVATKDNHRRRGTTLQDTFFALSGLEEETVSHLFFTCNIANKVWNMCNRWVGVSTTHHNHSCVHFQNFSMLHFNNKGNNLWKGLWISIIWNTWSHRNRVVFRKEKVDVEEIFTMAQLRVWTWIKHKSPIVKFSYVEWLQCPIECIRSVS